MVKSVRVQELIEGIYVTSVEDLFGDPTGGSLILFFRHTRHPFASPAQCSISPRLQRYSELLTQQTMAGINSLLVPVLA